MGINFFVEDNKIYAEFPSGQNVEITKETLKFFNDYNADIVAYEKETVNIIRSYMYSCYISFFSSSSCRNLRTQASSCS